MGRQTRRHTPEQAIGKLRDIEVLLANSKPLELVTYPDTDHDFVSDGSHYNAKSYADALARTQARLKVYFGQ